MSQTSMKWRVGAFLFLFAIVPLVVFLLLSVFLVSSQLLPALTIHSEDMPQLHRILLIVSLATIMSFATAYVISYLAGRYFRQHFTVFQQFAEHIVAQSHTPAPVHSMIKELDALGTELQEAGRILRLRDAELRRREERYRTLVEQSPVAVVEWDVNMNISVWNDAAAQMFGYSAEETVGQSIALLQLSNKPTLVQDFFDEFQFRSRFDSELRLRRKDGAIITCRAANNTVRSSDGELIGYMSLVEDVTEQRRIEDEVRRLNSELEARVEARTHDLSQANNQLKSALTSLKRTQSELVRSEKLASLGALVAGVSHELNTPIGNALMAVTALQGDSRRLQKEFESGQMKRSALATYLEGSVHSTEVATRNLDRAASLISSFKQVAADQTSSQSRLFMLDQQVEEVLLTLMPTLKTSGTKVKTDIPNGLSFNSYPGPLGQVMTNLINNAVIHGYDGKGGEIHINATSQPNRIVAIDVIDYGKGVPEASLAQIFDPFFSTRLGAGGTGLGLNIVHNVVCNVLGGSITASSDESGTCFHLEIPLDAPDTQLT